MPKSFLGIRRKRRKVAITGFRSSVRFLALLAGLNRFQQSLSRLIVESPTEIAEDFQCVLRWRFRNEARNRFVITNQDDLFLFCL